MANHQRTKHIQSNIRIFERKKRWNVGIVIFGIIFLYLIVTVLLYITAPRVSRYEVRIGSIINDTAYTGIALRQEQVVTSEQEGYINYYAGEGEKVKYGANTHTISTEKIELASQEPTEEAEAGADKTLTEEQKNNFARKVQSFGENFSGKNFDTVYSFKNELNTTMDSISNENKVANLNALLEANTGGIQLLTAQDDGVLIYGTDGYEGLTLDAITAETFDQGNYALQEFQNNSKISAGDPVYKLITSENWELVIPIDKEMRKNLEEKKNVRVRFTDDDETIRAGLTLVDKENDCFAVLSFNDSMIRYATERFIEVELILEDQTGLKIPKTAKVEKEFYVVPEDYITQGGNSRSEGVLYKSSSKKDTTEFKNVTIYYAKDGNVYLDTADLAKGNVLLKPESQETFTIGKKEKLDGVYNINKGYAQFRQIQILCESEEYYIVESGNSYGLTNYDHIALDGSSVNEHQVIVH